MQMLQFDTVIPNTVSYTHLDVYKRQAFVFPAGAGVILNYKKLLTTYKSFPRRCGGDPQQIRLPTL